MKRALNILLCLSLICLCGWKGWQGGTRKQKQEVAAAAATGWNDTNNWYALYDGEYTNATQMLDVSGNGYHVSNLPSVATGPTYTTVTASPLKHSWKFTASGSQYFKAATKILNGKTQATFVAWIKINPDTSSSSQIIGENNSNQGTCGLRLKFTTKGGIETVNAGSYAQSFSSTEMTTNAWHFVAFRWTQSSDRTGEYYEDGTYVTNLSWANTFVTDTPLILGYYYYPGSPYYFGGEIAFAGIMECYATTNQLEEIRLNTNPSNYLRSNTFTP
jgi:hypothetical protein